MDFRAPCWSAPASTRRRRFPHGTSCAGESRSPNQSPAAFASSPVGTNQHSDIITTHEDGRGTSRSYTVSRLRREARELYEEVRDGRLSANAAAIQACLEFIRAWPLPRAKMNRFNAIVAKVEAEATPEERAEHKGALLSSMGSTVIGGVVQRRRGRRLHFAPGRQSGRCRRRGGGGPGAATRLPLARHCLELDNHQKRSDPRFVASSGALTDRIFQVGAGHGKCEHGKRAHRVCESRAFLRIFARFGPISAFQKPR